MGFPSSVTHARKIMELKERVWGAMCFRAGWSEVQVTI